MSNGALMMCGATQNRTIGARTSRNTPRPTRTSERAFFIASSLRAAAGRAARVSPERLAETYQQVAFRQPIRRTARGDGAGMGLDQVREDWTRLGAADPLWAVLVSPEHRHGRWDVDQFLTTGRPEIEAVLGHLARLGVTPRWGEALDFGCGAGR